MVARWLIGWAPLSTQVTPQWVVLTSWQRQQYTAVQLGEGILTNTRNRNTVQLFFLACCSLLYLHPTAERTHQDKNNDHNRRETAATRSQRAWEKESAAAVVSKQKHKDSWGTERIQMPFDRTESCRNFLTSSASWACGLFIWMSWSVDVCMQMQTKGSEVEKETEQTILCDGLDQWTLVWHLLLYYFWSVSQQNIKPIWQWICSYYMQNLFVKLPPPPPPHKHVSANHLILSQGFLSVLERTRVGPIAWWDWLC